MEGGGGEILERETGLQTRSAVIFPPYSDPGSFLFCQDQDQDVIPELTGWTCLTRRTVIGRGC